METKTRFLSIETLDGVITLNGAKILHPDQFMVEIKWFYSPFDYDIEKVQTIVKTQLCVGRNFKRTDDYILFSFPICEMKMNHFEKD